MNLPFTREQFFEVFASYNVAVWPAQVVLVALAVSMTLLVLRSPEKAGRFVSAGLALLWCWMGLAYHLAFFWHINPAAPFFAMLSLGASAAFAWFGVVRASLNFKQGWSASRVAGLAVIMFALAGYPAIGAIIGHRYPAAPTFGLPCPITIFTFGILLMANRSFPKAVIVAPLLWAIIGSAAAFTLDVIQDLGLVAMIVLGAYMMLRRGRNASSS